jgi:hypothetical protein
MVFMWLVVCFFFEEKDKFADFGCVVDFGGFGSCYSVFGCGLCSECCGGDVADYKYSAVAADKRPPALASK